MNSNRNRALLLIWMLLALASIASLTSSLNDRNKQIESLKAQIAVAQPTAVSGAIFIEPTDQPLDRVTWTDPDGKIHLLACGEPVADDRTGEMKLVSQYRVGKTITKVSSVIP